MATGGSSFELFECQICLQDILERDPRTLSCNHTFCQPCLQRLLQAKNITCPTCRFVTNVAEGDLEKLPRNFDLAKMKEWEKSWSEPTEPFCEICKSTASEVKASFRCKECLTYMCAKCKEIHSETPAFGFHLFDDVAQRKERGICQVHGKEIKFISVTCKVGVCLVCSFDPKHLAHKQEIKPYDLGIKVLTKEYDTLQRGIQSTLQGINMAFHEANLELQRVNTATEEILAKEYEAHATIQSQTKGILVEIDKRYKSPLNDYMQKLAQIWQECNGVYSPENMYELNFEDLQEGIDTKCNKVRNILQKSQKVFEGKITVTHNLKVEAKGPEYFIKIKEIKSGTGLGNFTEINNVVDREEYGKPGQLMAAENGNVFVCDVDYCNIDQLNVNGKVEMTLTINPDFETTPFGIDIYQDTLFIGTELGIIMTPLNTRGKRIILPKSHDATHVDKFSVDQDEYILVSNNEKGEIIKIHIASRTCSVVKKKLKTPTFLTITHDVEAKYIVTERKANKVTIFDEH